MSPGSDEKPKEEATTAAKGEEAAPAEKAKKKTRRPPFCRFFNTPRGCLKGDECPFRHELKQPKPVASSAVPSAPETAVEAPAENKEAPKKVQPFVPQKIVLKQDQLGSEEQKTARNSELNYFKRRYRHCIVNTNDKGATAVSFKYFITEPDWPFDVKSLSLSVELQEGHPLIQPAVTLAGDKNRQMPPVLLNHVLKTINEAITAKYQIFANRNAYEIIGKVLIHWIDRNVLSMFVEGLRKTKLNVEAEKAGISLVLPASQPSKSVKEENIQDKSELSPKSENYVTDVTRDMENLAVTNEENAPKTLEPADVTSPQSDIPPPVASTSAPAAEFPLRLTLAWNNVSQKIASFSPVSLVFVLRCVRCKEERHQEIPAKGYREFRCSKCALVHTIRTQPEIVHENSAVLAKIDCRGCQPVDLVLLDCSMKFVCFECNTEDNVQKMNYGNPHKSWCKNCHTPCEFVISLARFSGDFAKCALPANPSSALPKAPKAKAPTSGGITPGTPLPDQGTCKHYRKSYRWFRFPCCGRVFPCDTCHEEANLGHEMKVANRMICGHCSTEQSLTGNKTECAGCSNNVVRSRSHFWEGGKGCRDKAMMNKNDVHKFASSHKKTAPKIKKKPADPK